MSNRIPVSRKTTPLSDVTIRREIKRRVLTRVGTVSFITFPSCFEKRCAVSSLSNPFIPAPRPLQISVQTPTVLGKSKSYLLWVLIPGRTAVNRPKCHFFVCQDHFIFAPPLLASHLQPKGP